MGTHHKTAFALTQHRLSVRSMLLAGIFVIAVLGAVFVDVDEATFNMDAASLTRGIATLCLGGGNAVALAVERV